MGFNSSREMTVTEMQREITRLTLDLNDSRNVLTPLGRKSVQQEIEMFQKFIASNGGIERACDDVNHPEHYTQGKIECIDALQAALTPEEFKGFLKGNVIKYLWREKLKGGRTSLEKAQWYLNKLTSVI